MFFQKTFLEVELLTPKLMTQNQKKKKLIHFPLKIFNKNNFTFYFNGEILNSISNLGKVN